MPGSLLSEVSICNSALIKLGQERISSLSETSKPAILCNERYQFVRNEVLEDHPWNFAVKRVSLAQLDDTPLFDYDYTFAIPSDALRIWKPEDEEIEFVVENGFILSNESTLLCRIISEVTNVELFTYSFAEAVSLRLAADLCYSITGNASLGIDLMKMYDIRLRRAKSNDAQEGTPDKLIHGEWIKARF